MSREQQQHAVRDDLVAAERVALVLGAQHQADQVVAGIAALLAQEVA